MARNHTVFTENCERLRNLSDSCDTSHDMPYISTFCGMWRHTFPLYILNTPCLISHRTRPIGLAQGAERKRVENSDKKRMIDQSCVPMGVAFIKFTIQHDIVGRRGSQRKCLRRIGDWLLQRYTDVYKILWDEHTDKNYG